jgi:hypothetical protein
MESVQASALFRSLAAQHPGVEVWPDDEANAGKWSYFWLVSRPGDGSARNLAYVRLGGGQLQRRGYDAAGDDEWLPVE